MQLTSTFVVNVCGCEKEIKEESRCKLFQRVGITTDMSHWNIIYAVNTSIDMFFVFLWSMWGNVAIYVSCILVINCLPLEDVRKKQRRECYDIVHKCRGSIVDLTCCLSLIHCTLKGKHMNKEHKWKWNVFIILSDLQHSFLLKDIYIFVTCMFSVN